MRARGLSLRAITEILARPDSGIMNPQSGEPYDKATIGRDVQKLDAEYQEKARGAAEEYKGQQLQECAEIKRTAWRGVRLDWVLKAMEREAKILGLDSPERIQGDIMVRYINDWRNPTPDATSGPADSDAQPGEVPDPGGGPALAKDDAGDEHGD